MIRPRTATGTFSVYNLAAIKGGGLGNRNRAPFDDDSDDFDDEDLDDEGDDTEENGLVKLDALEAEELEAVETNESATILVDEVSEIKALRRDEMALDMDKAGRRRDEFVCMSCFLLLKKVQLADADNALCVDCV